MKGYIGDRFDRVAASLTPDDCREIIAEAAGDTQTAQRFRDSIAACEAARYAPMEADVGTDLVQETIELIHLIEKQASK